VPRVLVVSYHFPPRPGVASARVGKLAKYLRRLGWEPAVVAGEVDGEEDADLLRDVEQIEVTRVRARRGLPSLQRFDWAVAALPAARRLARGADVVLVSGGPFAPFVLGPALRRPYVLDLRDPWSWEPRFDRLRPGLRRRAGLALERRAERTTVTRAAALTAVGPEIADAYVRAYPSLAGRVHVVRHGFDPDDFAEATHERDGEPTVVHVGTMQRGDRTPELLVSAAAVVRERGHPLRVRLVGMLPVELGVREPWVDVVGRLPRRQAIAEMRKASVLWLQPGQLDFLVTGKVYEYLASRRPIVAVAPTSGSVAALLRATGGAVFADADVDSCAAAIEQALAGDVPPLDEAQLAELAQPGPARIAAGVLAAAVEHAR
jgi:glycosyltransferase involved in cell wall biosynthesis